jgi:hypothetical protein
MTFQELKDFINVTPTFSGDLNSQKAAFTAVVDKIAEVLYQYVVSPNIAVTIKGAAAASVVDAAPVAGHLYKIDTSGDGTLNTDTDDEIDVVPTDLVFHDGSIWHKIDAAKNVSQINTAVASAKPAYGAVYKITSAGGTLTEGTLRAEVGDLVMWNGNQFVKLTMPVNSATYGTPMVYMGGDTAANIEAIKNPVNGMVFTIATTGGTVTGCSTTTVGDAIIYNKGAWTYLADIDEAE